MNEIKEEKHSISLYVVNHPGVLSRIALVFTRRGYNIDSLVVSNAKDPEYSWMNIEATGDKRVLSQMLKQLRKLVDVVKAVDYGQGKEIIQREMALFKITCTGEKRIEAMQIAQTFNCQPIDINEETITFQALGRSEKLDALQRGFMSCGIKEMVRSGKVLMTRET